MELKDLLEKALGNHEGVQLKISSLRESPCSSPGQNFMSAVSLVHMEGELTNGAPYSKSVFVKRPPPTPGHQASVDDAFANEVLMYQAVLPLITSTADVTSVPCPRHYHAAGDVIVLEDLAAQGYGVGDVAQGLDLATALNVVEALAKFHAASYQTSVVEKHKFFKTIQKLKPMGLIVSSNRTLMETSLRRAIRYMEAEEDLKSAAASLQKLQGRVTDIIRELRQPKRVAVLAHGDFWLNNILIRKNIEGFVNTGYNQFRIIDLQTCAFQSPAVDFWLFLYTSICPAYLEAVCENFIQLYCSTFLKYLDHTIAIEHIPSPTSLMEELSSKELYGFLAATAYLPALYLKPEKIDEMVLATEEEREHDGFLEKFVNPEFKNRLIEVARYCVEKRLL